MDVGPSLIAHGQAAIAVEPGQRTLDDPAMPPQALARLDATPGDPRRDATLTASKAASGIVVAFIRMQFSGTATWASTTPARLVNGWDCIEGGL